MNYAHGMPVRHFHFRFVLTLTVLLVSAMTSSIPVIAQQKTGPGIMCDDSLTWHGITLYGVVDIGLQYDTHSAPFTPYRPPATGKIMRSNTRASATRPTPTHIGQ